MSITKIVRAVIISQSLNNLIVNLASTVFFIRMNKALSHASLDVHIITLKQP